jgi:hypothetical protein
MDEKTEVISLQSDRRTLRPEIDSGCFGAEIDRLAVEDMALTNEQAKLAKASFNGHPQIIRGVAGSGKTWVLANHLARRVARNSQRLPGLAGEYPRIGVVCFNRCLVPFIERRACEAYDKLPHGTKCNCGVAINHMNGFMYDLTQSRGGPFTYLHVNKQDERDARKRAAGYLEQIGQLKRAGALEPTCSTRSTWMRGRTSKRRSTACSSN